MNHRWGQRVPVDLSVRLRGPRGNGAPGRICNLSMSGALIRTELVSSLLSPVEVILGDETLSGHVVRIEDGLVAVEWWPVASDRVAARLRALLPGAPSPAIQTPISHEAPEAPLQNASREG